MTWKCFCFEKCCNICFHWSIVQRTLLSIFFCCFLLLGGAGLGPFLPLMLLFLVLWLEPVAWEIHVLGLGHLATITGDVIVTDLLLDGSRCLVHGLGPLVSCDYHFTCWNTDDEMYLGKLDGYQNEHFLTILDLVMLKIAASRPCYHMLICSTVCLFGWKIWEEMAHL